MKDLNYFGSPVNCFESTLEAGEALKPVDFEEMEAQEIFSDNETLPEIPAPPEATKFRKANFKAAKRERQGDRKLARKNKNTAQQNIKF